MEKETFTRKELYDLVWSVPLLTLSKKYTISDVGLRKICIRMEIPLPRAGHWQKLEFNKKTDKIPLSTSDKVDQTVTLTLRTEATKNSLVTPSPSKTLQQKIETELKPLLSVPERLSNPDKLIVAARENLNRKEQYLHNGMISCERGYLDITVAKPNAPRALRFMDTLIKILRKRGHSIEIRNDKTCALIDGQAVEIRVKEKLKKEIVKGQYYDSTVYHPTGILAFQTGTYYDKEWKDGNVPLEEMLSKIIAKLELIAAQQKEREIELKKMWAIRDEEERVRKEYQLLKDKDLSEFKNMLLKSSRWKKAVNLRLYIDQVEANARQADKLTDELQAWIVWARKKADWYDPFTETSDELLQDIDREKLEPIKRNVFLNW